MKKLALPIIALLLLLAGFMLVQNTGASNFIEAPIPKINEEKTGTVGDIFFEFYRMAAFESPDNWKYDLTIVELTNEKIGLQYSEYFYKAGWLVKQGFNKRFDYAIADKVIRFKGYEFEILGVNKGQLRYRRIK